MHIFIRDSGKRTDFSSDLIEMKLKDIQLSSPTELLDKTLNDSPLSYTIRATAKLSYTLQRKMIRKFDIQ